MAELEIRAAKQADLDLMLALNHHSGSEYAYKLELTNDKGIFTHSFQRVFLPRAVNIKYPRDETALINSWSEASAIFVGLVLGELIAYVALEMGRIKDTVRVTDLVVAPVMRRKGVGSGILLACEGWAHDQKARRILMEIQMRTTRLFKWLRNWDIRCAGIWTNTFLITIPPCSSTNRSADEFFTLYSRCNDFTY
jgi:GNAT superfamily N-acetyltransferase